jgi:flavin reductase (DIM6/NTAB) family NADH-FMN oxidoreductase RutF
MTDHIALFGPRQVVLVTSRATTTKPMSTEKEEKHNILAVDWHMPCGTTHYAIALHKDTFSHKIISQSQSFIVNFIPNTMKEIIEFCGTTSGKHTDKFIHLKLEIEEGEKVDAPKLKKAAAILECHVTDIINCNDTTIFVGKILQKQLKEMSTSRPLSWNRGE